LRRRDDPGGLPRVTDTEANLDEPIFPNARRDGERDTGMDDLEIRYLDTLPAACDFVPSGHRRRTDLHAEGLARFGRRNNDDGSLNLEHMDLLKEQKDQTLRTDSG
jgi:hypothetical protein